MLSNNNTQAFFALVKAGLWEQDVRLLQFDKIDYAKVLELAEEQSLVGLVAAGLEHVYDVKIPQKDALQFVGSALQLEQRNQAMNHFIGVIVSKLCEAGIRVLLVKGSALARCYEKPSWRSCGDIDFFFSREDYIKAVDFLLPYAMEKVQDARFSKSTGLVIGGWIVELHGTLRCGLSSKLVKETDSIQQQVFQEKDIRVWCNDGIDILIPGVNSDLFLLFTHFVRHFYKEGVIIRQLCDWCRFLWTYREDIDIIMLSERLHRTGLMDEWKAFAALTVDYLGMPLEAMPFYCDEKKWHVKGEKILDFIIKGGYQNKIRDTIRLAKIFPINTLKFLPSIWFQLNWIKVKEWLLGE